jgi:2-phospho-L-lactate guanylyltransferase
VTDADIAASAATDPHVLVPFDADDPKSRLSPLLDRTEREAFARAMLTDVLTSIRAVGVDHAVLSTAPVDADAPVVVDERPLTAAVNARLAGDMVGPDEPPLPAPGTPVAVVMADLPLATPAVLQPLLFGTGTGDEGLPDVTMAPGLGGGTNALCVRDPSFRVDYHGASCRDHREIARERGLDVGTVDSFRLATDIDERADLVEVLLHADDSRAASWLREAGFAVDAGEGRVRVRRD